MWCCGLGPVVPSHWGLKMKEDLEGFYEQCMFLGLYRYGSSSDGGPLLGWDREARTHYRGDSNKDPLIPFLASWRCGASCNPSVVPLVFLI